MPHLSEAHPRGLDLWTFGTITAQSGRRNSVIAALTFTGGFSAVRRRIREWLYDGADRSTPSPKRIDVLARFAPLMRWVLSLWKSNDLALAVEPTTLSDELRVIVVSAVYRGYAVPVACVVMHANKPGKRIEPAAEPLPVCRHSLEYEGRRVGSPSKVALERNRLASAFRLGLAALSRLLAKGGMWRRV